MTKADLIGEVAKKCSMTKKDAGKVVETILGVVETALAKGQKVQLVGFGTFEVRKRAARRGRNPQTGAPIKIAASKVPAFKAGKNLKESVA